MTKAVYRKIITEEINNNKYVCYVYLINIKNRGVIMKKIFLPLILFFSFQTFALTNAEVRNVIQTEVVDLTTVPMQVDSATKMTDVYVSTRGIVYEYNISVDQDALGDISTILTTIKSNSVQLYCDNDAMAFYKTNNIDAFYVYYDVSDNLVGLFRVSNFDC